MRVTNEHFHPEENIDNLTWQNPGGAEVFMVGGVWSQR